MYIMLLEVLNLFLSHANLVQKLYQKIICDELKKIDSKFNDKNKIHFSEHHLSHAASAFYSSNLENAAILVADGVGEWVTTTIARSKNNKIEVLKN